MTIVTTINKQEIISATDQCVMCGLCLPHCPTYAVAKTESESPRGRIALVRALYEGQLEASESISTHLNHCLTCMSCETVCPANVDYEKIIDAGRAATNSQTGIFKQLQKSLLLICLSEPAVRKPAKLLINGLRTTGLHRIFSNLRLFKLLPDSIFTSIDFSRDRTNVDTSKPNVMLINTCAGDLANDLSYRAAKKVLATLGCNIIESSQTLCCGALHQHSGNLKTAHELRENFINAYSSHKPDYIISLATGCGAQIKRYPQLDDSLAAKELANKLIDINEFILQFINNNTSSFKPLATKVFLHTPCSQKQVSNDINLVEKLLHLIPDIKIIKFEDDLTCCGAGGINTLNHSKLAEQLIENKVEEITNANASYLVSSNIGCALHFQAQLRSESISIQVCHPITLLAQQMV